VVYYLYMGSIWNRTPFYHLQEDLYDYGRHDKNLSATRYKEIRQQAFHVMDVHFDYLYSVCNTQEDRNKLFWQLLAWLDDASEKELMRSKYYGVDKGFARADKKKCRERRRKQFASKVRHLLKNVLLD